MLTKVLAGVVLALVVALGVTGLGLKRSLSANGELRSQNAGLIQAAQEAAEREKTTRAISTRRGQKIASMARKSALLEAQLEDALRKNREWADSTVPQEVQDALK